MKTTEMKGLQRMQELAQVVNSSRSVLLFPHSRMDGDAAGSCAALCACLRRAGKQAWIFFDEMPPDNLRFLVDEFLTDDPDILAQPELCMAVDCGEEGRFPSRKAVFYRGKRLACIDHHEGGGQFEGCCYVDPQSAACGELVLALLLEMGAEITPFAADALYAAIAMDTGNFRFSNTTEQTHTAVAKLYRYGLNHESVCSRLYDSERPEKLRLHSLALSQLEIFAGGRAGIVCVSQQMLSASGAQMWESEGLNDAVRSIAGVKISALLKEEGPQTVKLSLRAKEEGEVLSIARAFGGGGHKKAAGGTMKATLSEARQLVMAEVCRFLSEGQQEARL